MKSHLLNLSGPSALAWKCKSQWAGLTFKLGGVLGLRERKNHKLCGGNLAFYLPVISWFFYNLIVTLIFV